MDTEHAVAAARPAKEIPRDGNRLPCEYQRPTIDIDTMMVEAKEGQGWLATSAWRDSGAHGDGGGGLVKVGRGAA
jgi:hypothetical protein